MTDLTNDQWQKRYKDYVEWHIATFGRNSEYSPLKTFEEYQAETLSYIGKSGTENP